MGRRPRKLAKMRAMRMIYIRAVSPWLLRMLGT
jgi:hypothetical protein